VPDEVGPAHPRRLVAQVPGPGRRADPAGEGEVAGEAQVTLRADFFRQLARLADAAAVLVGDDRSEGRALSRPSPPSRATSPTARSRQPFWPAAPRRGLPRAGP